MPLIAPVPSSPGFSRTLGFFAVLLSCVLVSTFDPTHHEASISPTAPQVQALDTARQLLFIAQTDDGSVRVLNLAHTIGEIGMLRAPTRHTVHDIRLESNGRVVWVLGDDGVYRYDTHTLRQTAFYPEQDNHNARFAWVREDSYQLQRQPSQSAPAA